MMLDLSGKKALVTGGRQGIGRAIVDAFVKAGADVSTCGRGKRPDNFPDSIQWLELDVSDSSAVKATAADFGNIDILVNNAGVQVEKTLPQSSDKDWDHDMGVNAKGVFNMCREYIPRIKTGGSIINIGSISGNVSDPSMALYNASKAFVHGLTRSIAVDHGPDIRCNAICPGWIETGMLDAGFELAKNPLLAKQDALARHAMRRFGKPEDIASFAVWLACDASQFATGQCYTMDGGMTAASPLNPGLF